MPRMPQSLPRHQDPRYAGEETPTPDMGNIVIDEPLPGVGQPDAQDEAAAAAQLLAENPALSRLIGGLVAQQVSAALTQAGVATQPLGGTDAMLSALVGHMERLTLMHAEQRPGYQKPLPAEEQAKRAAGWNQMHEVIDYYRQQGIFPRYRLVQEPLFAGEIEYQPGSVIESYLIPNEYMAPENDAAREIHAAMMQWIGGPQMSIGERLAEAERERRSGPNPIDPMPFKRAGLPDASPVVIVSEPPEERGFDPRRPPQTAYDLANPAVHRI